MLVSLLVQAQESLCDPCIDPPLDPSRVGFRNRRTRRPEFDIISDPSEQSLEHSRLELSGIDKFQALKMLWTAEYARIADVYPLSADVTLALGSELSGLARSVLQESGRRWMVQRPWADNHGVPPRGVVLVTRLEIDGEVGLVNTHIGVEAGRLACGQINNSRYAWNGNRWEPPDNDLIGQC